MAEKNSSTAVKIISALCIIIPPLGALGIHDFVVGRKKYGIAHIAMTLLPIGLTILAWLILAIAEKLAILTICGTNNGCPQVTGTALLMGTIIAYLSVSSYIWAIVECSMILMGRIAPINNTTRESKKRTL